MPQQVTEDNSKYKYVEFWELWNFNFNGSNVELNDPVGRIFKIIQIMQNGLLKFRTQKCRLHCEFRQMFEV